MSKAMYRPSTRRGDRAAQPRDRGSARRRSPSIPAPKWATGDAASIRDSVSSRTWPPSSAASCLHHRRPVDGGHEVRVAAPAEHRERHPPDVARRRRVGRVEVAVGVEPGDRRGGPPGRAGAQPGHRPGMGRAVAAERRAGARRAASAAPSAAATWSRSRGRYAQIAARFFARGSGSGAEPGSIASVARVAQLGPGQAGPRRAAARAARARGARPGVRSIPRRWPPSAVGDADDDDRSVPCARHGAASWDAGCASPSSPSSATSPAGSSRSSTCCAPRTSRATRWPSCSRWPTTRRAACGTASGSATPSRPAIRSCAREIAALYDDDRARRRADVRRRRGGDLLPR